MAKIILNADLYDNVLTPEPGDYTAKPVITGTYHNTDIAADIVAERTEYRQETIENILALADKKKVQAIANGKSLVDGVGQWLLNLSGSFEGESPRFDPEKHRVGVTFTPGKALYFSHGFGITYKERTHIVPPADVDVIMVAPKGSGTSLRTMFLEGRGLNSSYAVYQDATGHATERTLAFGIGIGSGYLFETTFKREVYSDLTGERGSLMGAIQGLLLAQYEVLREHGHSPSEAFNETVEELTQSLMPLFAKNGMDWMYANCSTTAQRGALDWMGPFHDAIKPVMEKLYHSVETGNEAQISIDSNSQPDYREKLNAELKALRESEMWQTAVTVRKLRPENN